MYFLRKLLKLALNKKIPKTKIGKIFSVEGVEVRLFSSSDIEKLDELYSSKLPTQKKNRIFRILEIMQFLRNKIKEKDLKGI